MSSIQQVLDEAWCMQCIADAQDFTKSKLGENVKLEDRKVVRRPDRCAVFSHSGMLGCDIHILIGTLDFYRLSLAPKIASE